jgi:hypothetical protein
VAPRAEGRGHCRHGHGSDGQRQQSAKRQPGHHDDLRGTAARQRSSPLGPAANRHAATFIQCNRKRPRDYIARASRGVFPRRPRGPTPPGRRASTRADEFTLLTLHKPCHGCKPKTGLTSVGVRTGIHGKARRMPVLLIVVGRARQGCCAAFGAALARRSTTQITGLARVAIRLLAAPIGYVGATTCREAIRRRGRPSGPEAPRLGWPSGGGSTGPSHSACGTLGEWREAPGLQTAKVGLSPARVPALTATLGKETANQTRRRPHELTPTKGES